MISANKGVINAKKYNEPKLLFNYLSVKQWFVVADVCH